MVTKMSKFESFLHMFSVFDEKKFDSKSVWVKDDALIYINREAVRQFLIYNH